MFRVDEVRIVIVDDSPFTVTILREILEHHGFKVVGSAASLGEVKTIVNETRPNLVTMDISMPGTDGFECTRAVHKIDPDIKVIVISSMKDDEIVDEAIKHRVSACVQKPIEEEELIAAINGILADDKLFELLQKEYFKVFKDSFKEAFCKMAGKPITFESEYEWKKEFTSEGIVVASGIIGKFSGKMFLSMSNQLAEELAVAIFKRKLDSHGDLANVLTEFSNIVTGNACSALNMENREYSLRVAPPSIIVGKNIRMSPPDFITHTVIAETAFGKVLLNVGLKRGS